jgi:DNA mismatch endonuclease (patch repair protein)
MPALRRRADIVFSRLRVAVFVDGCFWHCCPTHGTKPASNGAWWAAKLQANFERDRDTDRQLTEAGWHVIRVWEHDEVRAAAESIAAALRTRDGAPRTSTHR